jgi:hypothetical protein
MNASDVGDGGLEFIPLAIACRPSARRSFVLLITHVNDFKVLSAGLPLGSVRFATGCCRSGPGHGIARHARLIDRAGVALHFA